MIDKVADKLKELTEDELIKNILSEIIPILHPGRIEYTHSSIEAGRDIVSFGEDYIGRSHILCVQAKSKKISYGAEFQSTVVAQTNLAKTEGVTLENGEKVYPNEVWFINSFPFEENKRRQVADSLKRMNENGIKFIPGNELSTIISKKCPHLLEYILDDKEKYIEDLTNKLKYNHDSRAFNLAEDKKIDDFFVDVSLCPSSHKANEILQDKFVFNDGTLDIIAKAELLEIEEPTTEEIIKSIVADYNTIKSPLIKMCDLFDINLSFRVLNELTIVKREYSKDDKIQILLDIPFTKQLNSLVNEIKKNLKSCPNKISEDIAYLKSIVRKLKTLEIFSNLYSKLFDITLQEDFDGLDGEYEISIFVDNIKLLLELSDLILIEGIPGIGKSTILKKMCLSILEKTDNVLFIPCFQLPTDKEYKNISDIINNNKFLHNNRKWVYKDTILIFDGLDESSLNLSEIIEKEASNFKKVIVTTRVAHKTKLRDDFTTILLSPLSTRSRDQFFLNWFSSDKKLLDSAQYLYGSFPDIDIHSRVPLLATTLASLIENNYSPRNRLEIYDDRLDLLLWKWDQNRGIKRFNIDNPSAKKRFLEKLAFIIHSDKSRIRIVSKNKMLEIFANTLGNIGYKWDFEDLLEDLTSHSGVINHEYGDMYSFGHLSFQEYLVGRYIANNLNIERISKLLENDWWLEPLKFYASIKGDITDLVDYLFDNDSFNMNINSIKQLVNVAIYTSPGVIDVINNSEELSLDEIY